VAGVQAARAAAAWRTPEDRLLHPRRRRGGGAEPGLLGRFRLDATTSPRAWARGAPGRRWPVVLVLPARRGGDVASVVRCASGSAGTVEVVVVDDGSSDATGARSLGRRRSSPTGQQGSRRRPHQVRAPYAGAPSGGLLRRRRQCARNSAPSWGILAGGPLRGGLQHAHHHTCAPPASQRSAVLLSWIAAPHHRRAGRLPRPHRA
jgi:hypothetical protein